MHGLVSTRRSTRAVRDFDFYFVMYPILMADNPDLADTSDGKVFAPAAFSWTEPAWKDRAGPVAGKLCCAHCWHQGVYNKKTLFDWFGSLLDHLNTKHAEHHGPPVGRESGPEDSTNDVLIPLNPWDWCDRVDFRIPPTPPEPIRCRSRSPRARIPTGVSSGISRPPIADASAELQQAVTWLSGDLIRASDEYQRNVERAFADFSRRSGLLLV